MTVHNRLPGSGTRRGKADPVDDIVQTALQQRHERLAGIALAPLGPREIGAELALKNPVIMLDLLLLTQMEAVLGRLAAPLLHHAWRR